MDARVVLNEPLHHRVADLAAADQAQVFQAGAVGRDVGGAVAGDVGAPADVEVFQDSGVVADAE